MSLVVISYILIIQNTMRASVYFISGVLSSVCCLFLTKIINNDHHISNNYINREGVFLYLS